MNICEKHGRYVMVVFDQGGCPVCEDLDDMQVVIDDMQTTIKNLKSTIADMEQE